MELTGKYSFDAPRDLVWSTLMNTGAIAEALPGVDELIPIEGESDTWKVDAKIQVASLGGTYSGRLSMSDKIEPEQYRLTVSGEGQQSIVNGSALINLTFDEEKQETLLTWTAEANLSGKLAGVGQRLVSSAAGLLAKRFFKTLAKQIPNVEE